MAEPSLTSPKPSNDWRDRCLDCDVDVFGIDEYYMVEDQVWEDAGMDEPFSGQLCIGCLEIRLNRQLTADDFSDWPINKGLTRARGSASVRLYARINGIHFTN